MSIFDSYNFDWSYGGSPVGDALGNYMTDNTGDGYSIVGDAINNYVTNGDASSKLGNVLGNTNWGNVLGTLGKLGTGIGTGISAYQSQRQPNYMFIPRYIGDGLASTTVIDTTKNKKDQLNQILGAGDYLSSLFGQGFNLLGGGFGGNKLSTLPTSIDNIYENSNYGVIGNAIDKNVRS